MEANLPGAWLGVIRRNLPYYARLSAADRDNLRRRVRDFIAAKDFEGCGGLRLNDEMRVTIAAHACLLLLRQDLACYPRLRSILVYPHAYKVKDRWRSRDGVLSDEVRGLLGQASSRGVVVLSWHRARADSAGKASGHNLLLHEFAHQLALKTGSFDGIPLLRDPAREKVFRRVLEDAYARHVRAVEKGSATVLRAYGAETPAEFFAVLTEAFFTRPRRLKLRQPALYAQLRALYGQDPACPAPKI